MGPVGAAPAGAAPAGAAPAVGTGSRDGPPDAVVLGVAAPDAAVLDAAVLDAAVLDAALLDAALLDAGRGRPGAADDDERLRADRPPHHDRGV